MLTDVVSSQRKVRVESFRLVAASVPTGTAAQTATGCTQGTYQCTVLKNGTGDFTVNFNQPFARTPCSVASPLHASSKLFATKVSESASAVRFAVFSDAGTATDPTSLEILVIGSDAADQI